MDQSWSESSESTLDLRMIAALIETSPIHVRRAGSRLPPGYDDLDIAVLDWIVGHAQGSRRIYTAM